VRRRLQREDGVSAIEFAIVLPLVFILVMGIIDISRGLYTLISIQEAAQEGAIYAAFEPGDPTEVRQRVVESVDDPTIATTDVTVTCPSPEVVAVTVEHDLELLTPVVSQWFSGGQIHIERTVTGDTYNPDETCVAST
jgi:Flp pilus assembly protein TadG